MIYFMLKNKLVITQMANEMPTILFAEGSFVLYQIILLQ